MQFFLKSIITLAIILIAVEVGKRYPSLGGLVSVMPLTGALVMIWLYVDSGGDGAVMQAYTRGAVWGLIPTVLFFVVAWFCFKKELPLPMVLGFSFGVWFLAAIVHQWLLRIIK